MYRLCFLLLLTGCAVKAKPHEYTPLRLECLHELQADTTMCVPVKGSLYKCKDVIVKGDCVKVVK